MSCCSDPGSGAKRTGGCCGGPQGVPWFSALCDPAVRRMFFRRFRRELLLGTAAGCLTSTAALTLGERLAGGLGPVLNGPWLHFHAAAVGPSALLGGLVLALRGTGQGWKDRLATGGWVLLCAVLGGILNGCLETGMGPAPFFQDGGLASVVGFGILGPPVIGMSWGILDAITPGHSVQ